MRNLEILFNFPGLVEVIATDPDDEREEIPATGYSDTYIADLMVDYDTETQRPYAWMSLNFDSTYPAVIWGLKLHGPAERFNVPQANLTDVPLYAAFGWAYYHFILEDGARLPQPFTSVEIDPTDYTQLALGHALATASG